MNLRTANQLTIVGACINVAQNPDHKPVWNGQPPADFGTEPGRRFVEAWKRARIIVDTSGGHAPPTPPTPPPAPPH